MQENLFGDLVKFLDIAGKSISMYSENHPSTQQAVEHAFQLIEQALRQKNVLVIAVLGADLLLDAQPLKRTLITDRFLKLLESRNVRTISFHRGITRQHLSHFLRLLNQPPARLKEQGGVEKSVDDQKISSIGVNKIRYGIIGEGQAVMDVAPGQEVHEATTEYKPPQTSTVNPGTTAEEMIAEVPLQISEYLSSGKLEDADRLSKKLITALGATQPAVRIAVLKVLPRVIVTLLQNERWKNVELTVALLLKNQFKKEQDEKVLDAFIEFFLNSFKRNFESHHFQACKETCATLELRPELKPKIESFFSSEISNLWPVLELELRGVTEGTESSLAFVKMCGRGGADYLLDWLSEEEDQRMRSRILSLLENTEPAQLLPELEKRLDDQRWYVVRNMVTLLSRVETPESVRLMKRALQNPDPRIAKEVLRYLFNATVGSLNTLLPGLLQHSDKAIRLQALRLVPRLGVEPVRSIIQSLAGNDPDDEVRRLATTHLNNRP